MLIFVHEHGHTVPVQVQPNLHSSMELLVDKHGKSSHENVSYKLWSDMFRESMQGNGGAKEDVGSLQRPDVTTLLGSRSPALSTGRMISTPIVNGPPETCTNPIQRQVDPLDPVQEVDPLDPVQEVDPLHPVQEVDPLHPVQEVDPLDPVQEVDPLDPVQEVDPLDPVQEVDPLDPIQKVDPLDPVQEVDPLDQVQEIDPVQEVDPLCHPFACHGLDE
ncbi:amelogenin-like [Hyperolius riggenbachi]|uniref:amelogenin-like n=1 Tax=Hyperolius riggenbachi TaxID=752182 RepID=UPI0035A39398